MMLEKSGRFKRGTYKPIRPKSDPPMTKVLVKNVNNEVNFCKWVSKMAERRGLKLYIANVKQQRSITYFFRNTSLTVISFRRKNSILLRIASPSGSKITVFTQTSSPSAKSTSSGKSS